MSRWMININEWQWVVKTELHQLSARPPFGGNCTNLHEVFARLSWQIAHFRSRAKASKCFRERAFGLCCRV